MEKICAAKPIAKTFGNHFRLPNPWVHFACQRIPLRLANPTFEDLYGVPCVFENDPERSAVKTTQHWHGLDPSGVERHVGYALDNGILRAHLP